MEALGLNRFILQDIEMKCKSLGIVAYCHDGKILVFKNGKKFYEMAESIDSFSYFVDGLWNGKNI